MRSAAAAATAAGAAWALLAVGASAAPAPAWGIDVSRPLTPADAACLTATTNVSFVIPRAWFSDGSGFDSNAAVTYHSAVDAGLDAHVYMFPCSYGEDPVSQVNQLLGNLTAHNMSGVTRIWFDVETNPSVTCGWKAGDKPGNCKWLLSLAAAAEASPWRAWGVYSSLHMWTELVADAATDCPFATQFPAFPLWYPHYEAPANPSFSDFTPFGGWSTPAIKQYADTHTVCGVGTDSNWAPQAPTGSSE